MAVLMIEMLTIRNDLVDSARQWKLEATSKTPSDKRRVLDQDFAQTVGTCWVPRGKILKCVYLVFILRT